MAAHPGVALESVEFDHLRVDSEEGDSAARGLGEQGADYRGLAAAGGTDDQAVRFVRFGRDVPVQAQVRCAGGVGQVAEVLVDQGEGVVDAGGQRCPQVHHQVSLGGGVHSVAQVRPDSWWPASAARASSTLVWKPRAPLFSEGVNVIL